MKWLEVMWFEICVMCYACWRASEVEFCGSAGIQD